MVGSDGHRQIASSVSNAAKRRLAIPAGQSLVAAGFIKRATIGIVVRPIVGSGGSVILRGSREPIRTIGLPQNITPDFAVFVGDSVVLFSGKKVFKFDIASGEVVDLGVDETYAAVSVADGHLVLRYAAQGPAPARLVDVRF